MSTKYVHCKIFRIGELMTRLAELILEFQIVFSSINPGEITRMTLLGRIEPMNELIHCSHWTVYVL